MVSINAPGGARASRDAMTAPGSDRASRFRSWAADALAGVGLLYSRSEEPRIDAASVRRLYHGQPSEAQQESLRALMTAREFDQLAPASKVAR